MIRLILVSISIFLKRFIENKLVKTVKFKFLPLSIKSITPKQTSPNKITSRKVLKNVPKNLHICFLFHF